MKNLFSHYYPKSKKQFILLWKECFFVPDTNVLLDLYRYTPSTRTELIDIFSKVSDRLWIPHQVGLEYFRDRPEVILTQVSMYQQVDSLLKTLTNVAEKEIEKNFEFRFHPAIDKKELLTSLIDAFNNVGKMYQEKAAKHPDWFKHDEILEILTAFFDGHVGDPYPPDVLENKFKEAKKRYENHVPPGYKDAEGKKRKDGNQKYGDAILWFQIIDKAKAENKPIIFITNDQTEDWWWISKGRTIGARPELMDEFCAEAEVGLHLYKSDQFMMYAREYLKVSVEQEAINEVQNLRLYDEKLSRYLHSQFKNYLFPLGLNVTDDPDSFEKDIKKLPQLNIEVKKLKNILVGIQKNSNTIDPDNAMTMIDKQYRKITNIINHAQSEYIPNSAFMSLLDELRMEIKVVLEELDKR